MVEFTHQDLSGARFSNVDLTGAELRTVDLSGAHMRGVRLNGAVLRGAELGHVRIDGEVEDLVINGVDVGPLIEVELDRRDPERALMRPTTPAGLRNAWTLVERRWADTLDRARALNPELLHESVGDEWTFIETLRHLVFATNAWVRRALLGEASPWSPLDLPFDEMADTPGIPRDRTARPSLDEVVALRRDRMATVRAVIDGLDDESLAARTTPVDAPGWPPPESFPVLECLRVVVNEEWLHRQFAERDLAVLEARTR